MKLDKIKFAQLIAFIGRIGGNVGEGDAEYIDDLIDIDVKPVALPINISAVDGLMACMAGGTQKIEAIRYYRSLTGIGLKESKDIVERYWMDQTPEN